MLGDTLHISACWMASVVMGSEFKHEMRSITLDAKPSCHSCEEIMKSNVERLFRAAYAYGAVINSMGNAVPEVTSTRPEAVKRSKVYYESQREFLEALDSSTAEDWNLKESIGNMQRQVAPVAYMELHQNKWFSLGIFVIFKGGSIPLHDHPGMNGALKVIAGKVRINSFTVTGRGRCGQSLVAKQVPSLLLESSDCPQLLEPEEKNIHELQYVSNSDEGLQEGRPYAAFVDFLSPPYGVKRRDISDEICNYYEVIPELNNSSVVSLRCAKASSSYWTHELPYIGPPLRELVQKMRLIYPESC